MQMFPYPLTVKQLIFKEIVKLNRRAGYVTVGEVILKIHVKIYGNQEKSVPHIQTLCT